MLQNCHTYFMKMWQNSGLSSCTCYRRVAEASVFTANPQHAPLPCLLVIQWGMLKMSCWLPDCALGTGTGCRAHSTACWCNRNMPLLPHSPRVISVVVVLCMHKYILFCVSCGTDTNRYEINIHDPHPPCVCQLSPQPFYSLEDFT